mmetsp:Transcript_3313/g.6308  ORF Transcript_3313/g.6308 Transcript_3313/m.6308 type:complete len:230 (+) Transcript_3313:690-1379(+)
MVRSLSSSMGSRRILQMRWMSSGRTCSHVLSTRLAPVRQRSVLLGKFCSRSSSRTASRCSGISDGTTGPARNQNLRETSSLLLLDDSATNMGDRCSHSHSNSARCSHNHGRRSQCIRAPQMACHCTNTPMSMTTSCCIPSHSPDRSRYHSMTCRKTRGKWCSLMSKAFSTPSWWWAQTSLSLDCSAIQSRKAKMSRHKYPPKWSRTMGMSGNSTITMKMCKHKRAQRRG